jgi:dUTP pyrophosphatase
MFPRSSLSKTPLRLANSVGIIDSGYRGNLIGAFDVISHSVCEPQICTNEENRLVACDYVILPFQRLVQICSPGLEPIFVEWVERVDTTLRGEGGFGSTGV